jgi:hypothetical protein
VRYRTALHPDLRPQIYSFSSFYRPQHAKFEKKCTF